MHDEISSSYRTCKDLQSLINITFNDVIKPLREAFKNNSKSKIIALEIKDAENKVFEYISSQITTIGNASEEDSSICLKEFPKSEICYRCIGLDDDTIQGLLKIRNISFLCFLEMEASDVIQLMEIYCVNKNDINAIAVSLNTIKQNIDLLYSNSILIDNTRNLIKLVTRLVDNKSTVDDIGIIGIPNWSDNMYQQEMKEISEKNDLKNLNCNDSFLHIDNQHVSKCLSNSNQNIDNRRSVSDCHPSSIISTKKPVNQETLFKAFKSNTTLSGITCTDDKSYLSTNQLADLNSLSVPNTPNVQKSRSVGGSEEVLNDIPNTNSVNRSTEFNISPTLHRKNYSRITGKGKPNQNRNIQLQRSLSHEFESKNLLNLKDNDGNLTNQQFQPSVFQFNPENLAVGSYNSVEKERRSSYEEKLIYKSSTMSCDFRSLIRPLSPGFSSKISYDMNNGFKYFGKHKFESENKFNIPNIVKPPICAVCKTKKFLPKFIFCEYCKIKVHKGCIEGTNLLSCIKNIKSPPVDRKNSENSVANTCIVYQGSDSNSNSTPESPLNLESGYNSAVNNNHISPRHPNKLLKAQKFDFSKIDEADSQKIVNIVKINQDNVNVEKIDNNKPMENNNKLSQRFESTESQDESSHLSRTNSISVALKEWEIPYKSLELGELLGKGSFWTVYKGKWHGEVAVKIMNIDPQDENDACMAAFKSEVGALHKTRHENLVLFMGACMEPPKLAIVTQLSQGETLFHQLHSRHLSIPVIRAINIASQVAKGMGYLHAKDILHKDLKSRNIFIESNSKVVISDFGLFDFVRMCKQAISGSYLRIPPGWLCYLAPELIRKLNLNSIFSNNSSEDLPFTKSSDIYAFGTVWYEILNSKWPFEGLPSEAIIYRVGKGIKESLKVVHAKEFKDLLIQCWSSKGENRPAFTNIVQILEKLPKLQRSPSYPVKSVSVVRSHDNLIA